MNNDANRAKAAALDIAKVLKNATPSDQLAAVAMFAGTVLHEVGKDESPQVCRALFEGFISQVQMAIAGNIQRAMRSAPSLILPGR